MNHPEAPAQDEFFENLLGDFLDEAGQMLDSLNENMLLLDEWVHLLEEGETCELDMHLMNQLFRSAHSFKGLSAMLGLHEINTLTHHIENIFDAARQDQLTLNLDIVELVFQSIDRLTSMVEALKEDGAEPVESRSIIDQIQRVLRDAGAQRDPVSQQDAEQTFADALSEISNSKEQDLSLEENLSTGVPTAEVDHFAGIVDESQVPAKYLSIFIDETLESLDTLTETLLALEGGDDGKSVETLLVTAHRIKGSAASIGLNRPAKLAHYMEDILQHLLESGDVLTSVLTDSMLKCTDALGTYLESLKSGNARSEKFNALTLELLAAQGASKRSEVATRQAKTKLESSPGNQAAGEPSDSSDQAASDFSGKIRSLSESLRKQISDKLTRHAPGFAGVVTFSKGIPLVGLKGRLVYEKLSNLGDVFYCDPPAEALENIETLSSLVFGVVTDKTSRTIQDRLRIAGVEGLDMVPLGSGEMTTEMTTTAPSQLSQEQTKAPVKKTLSKDPSKSELNKNSDVPKSKVSTSSKPAETLRVDIERLDQLMNLAGELVINKARFAQIGDRLKSLVGTKHTLHLVHNISGTLDHLAEDIKSSKGNESSQTDLEPLHTHVLRIQADLEIIQREVNRFNQARSSISDLFEAVHQLDRISDGIQKSVMDTRMVPIGPLFGRFKRVVRDITRGNGKEIKLVIRGEKTELDKRMIDELSDPLIHLVRNSADHGIETPNDREAAGKPRQGVITLDAFHRGNSIFVQVSDDGKGLDLDAIRSKAIEKSILSESDLEKMTPHQIYQLIWEPGFTTAKVVTDVSGRGMGMDIVRSKIEELNGLLELESTPGRGATFTIKLPLTLAILPSLMVVIDSDTFALPLESVVEIVSVKPKDFGSVHGLLTAHIRGRVVSVVDLQNVLHWSSGQWAAARKYDADTTLVIVGSDGSELALPVDTLLGEEDIVIKSLAENYRNVQGIAGASILGDGHVSLILDVAALVDLSNNFAVTTSNQREEVCDE